MDINVITENLTELLQNSINMASVFYDIFLNPEAMDVQLKQFDSDNHLQTITIPNRAKDRKISLDGEGSPEGVVTANIGAAYVDTLNQLVYFKVSGTGNTGWLLVLTQNGVETYVNTMLNDYIPSIPMVDLNDLSTENLITLEDNKGFYLSRSTGVSFILPSITDNTKSHRIIVQLDLSSASLQIDLGTEYIYGSTQPDFSVIGSYNLEYKYDNNLQDWVCEIQAISSIS